MLLKEEVEITYTRVAYAVEKKSAPLTFLPLDEFERACPNLHKLLFVDYKEFSKSDLEEMRRLGGIVMTKLGVIAALFDRDAFMSLYIDSFRSHQVFLRCHLEILSQAYTLNVSRRMFYALLDKLDT
jgi:hypothetical protein